MTDRPRISLQYMHEERHWVFPRSSGLPVGYFRRGWSADALVVWMCAVAALVVLSLWAGGWLA